MAGQEQCVRYPNWNSVSYSLEFSFYDWTIAEMAKAAGDMDAYEEFKARSYNSLKHWDAEAGNADGTLFSINVLFQFFELISYEFDQLLRQN